MKNSKTDHIIKFPVYLENIKSVLELASRPVEVNRFVYGAVPKGKGERPTGDCTKEI